MKRLLLLVVLIVLAQGCSELGQVSMMGDSSPMKSILEGDDEATRDLSAIDEGFGRCETGTVPDFAPYREERQACLEDPDCDLLALILEDIDQREAVFAVKTAGVKACLAVADCDLRALIEEIRDQSGDDGHSGHGHD